MPRNDDEPLDLDDDDDRPRRKRRRDEDDDDRPPRRKGKAGRLPTWAWVALGVALTGCIGFGTVVYVALTAASEHPLVRAAVGVRGLTEDNLKRLKPGMPEGDVVGLFGKPNTVQEKAGEKLILPGPAGPGPVTKRTLIWLGRGGGLTAEFHDGKLAMAVGQVGEFKHAVLWGAGPKAE